LKKTLDVKAVLFIPLIEEVEPELELVVLGVRFTPADSRSCLPTLELALLPVNVHEYSKLAISHRKERFRDFSS
jgi:hypothetical protein